MIDTHFLYIAAFVLFTVEAAWHKSLTAAGLACLTATLLF
jgi:hypothetical protein